MKQIAGLVVILLQLLFGALHAQDCLNLTKYEEKMLAADSCIAAGDYSSAYDNYNAAAVYCRDSLPTVNATKDQLFATINELRQDALEQARRTTANELAYKGKLALRDGDRTTAFQLGAFAHRFIDPDNNEAVSIMSDAYHYNYDPAHEADSTKLCWRQNLEGSDRILVSALALSMDGQYLCAGNGYGTTRVWDRRSGRTVWSFAENLAHITDVALSPDNRFVAIASIDTIVSLWNLQNGQKIGTFNGHTDDVGTLTFSPDSRYLLTGSNDHTIKVWDVNSRKAIRTLEGHSSMILNLDISSDGKHILSTAFDRTTRVWNFSTGQQLAQFDSQSPSVFAAAFSPDDQKMVTCDGNVAVLWDLETGEKIRRLGGPRGYILALDYSPDGQHIAAAYSTGALAIWDIENGRTFRSITNAQAAKKSMLFSPNGKEIITGSISGVINVWDINSGDDIVELSVEKGSIKHAALSPDDQYVCTAKNGSNDVTLWSVSDRRPIRSFTGHTAEVNYLAFSPGGEFLLTAGKDHTARLWQVSTGQEIYKLEGHEGVVGAAIFSPDGQYMATASADQLIKVWEVASGKEIYTLSGHNDKARSLAFSPSGEFLASGSNDGLTKLWRIADEQLVREFESPSYQNIVTIAFSPDGRQLITGSNSFHPAKIWDIESGKMVYSLASLSEMIDVATFSPNGKYIFTNNHAYVRLWATETGQMIRTLRGHSNNITAIAYSGSGDFLITSSWDKTVKFWQLTPEGMIEQAGPLATFGPDQIQKLGLYDALIQIPNSWNTFLATASVEQLFSFANFLERYAQNSNNPSYFNTLLEHAQQCYSRARYQNDHYWLLLEQAHTTALWAEKLLTTDKHAATLKCREAVALYKELQRQKGGFEQEISQWLESLVDQGLNTKEVNDFLTDLNQ